MKNFNLSDKADFGGMVGYIVAIEIDALEPCDIPYELEEPIYTVRCYANWCKNGYFDFKRLASDLKKVQKEKKSNED